MYYYPPEEPVSPHAQDVHTEDTSTPTPSKDTKTDSIYPATPSRATTFSPAEPSCRVPGNYIGEHEDAGLPGTKDLRDYAIEKAEHVVKNHIKRSNDISTRQDKRRKDHLQHGDPEKAAQSDIEKRTESPPPEGGGILSALLNLYRNYEHSLSSSTVSSRRSSFDGYNTPPDQEDLPPRLSRRLEKRSTFFFLFFEYALVLTTILMS